MRIRIPVAWAVLVTLAVIGAQLLVHVALADVAGNNGTVKVQDSQGTAPSDDANEPHVCTFVMRGFDFDANQPGTWSVTQADTGAPVTSGSWSADATGAWQTAALALANDHYRLSALAAGAPTSSAKTKVFWVGCAPTPTTVPS